MFIVFTDDIYQLLKQKVMYNTIGITSNDKFNNEKVSFKIIYIFYFIYF